MEYISNKRAPGAGVKAVRGANCLAPRRFNGHGVVPQRSHAQEAVGFPPSGGTPPDGGASPAGPTKHMQTIPKTFIAISLLLPSLALAAAPAAGTSDYLRSLGYTDAQLSPVATTEEREAFEISTGDGDVEDPVGDVVDRKGGVTSVTEPYGDVSSVSMTRNDSAQTWDAVVTVGGAIPEKIDRKIQLSILIDADGDTANNAPGGVRVGTDAEFTVQTTPEHPWYTDFRWYNKDADFWATNKETTLTFEMSGETISMSIPFAEVSGDVTPSWRVVLAVAKGNSSEIDVVPGIGFPPPKGETYPTPAETSTIDIPPAAKWVVITTLAAILSVLVHRKFAKKRKK